MSANSKIVSLLFILSFFGRIQFSRSQVMPLLYFTFDDDTITAPDTSTDCVSNVGIKWSPGVILGGGMAVIPTSATSRPASTIAGFGTNTFFTSGASYSVSIEFSIDPNGLNTHDYYPLLTKGWQLVAASYSLWMVPDTGVIDLYYPGFNTYCQRAVPGGGLVRDQRYTITTVFDASVPEHRIYFEGVAVGAACPHTTVPTNFNNEVEVGWSGPHDHRRVYGTYYRVAFFNDALSQQQIVDVSQDNAVWRSALATQHPACLPCTGANLTTIDWPTMLNTGVGAPNVVLTATPNLANLEITFTVTVDIVSGATYVIDFVPYTGEIDNPTNCENREFTNAAPYTFPDLWVTSTSDIGQSTNLMYPPGNQWQVTSNGACEITYTSTWKWSDFAACTHKDGTTSSVAVTQESNPSRLVLSGKVIVTVVAPLSPSSTQSPHAYYHYALQEHPFEMGVYDSASSLGTTTVQNFDFSGFVTGVAPGTTGNIEFTVFTLADQMFSLVSGNILAAPMQLSAEAGYTMGITAIDATEQVNCRQIGANGCYQSWKVSVSDLAACPEDFSGTFQLQWTVSCRQDGNGVDVDPACSNILQFLAGGQLIMINVATNFQQVVCDSTAASTSLQAITSVPNPTYPYGIGEVVSVTINVDITGLEQFIASVVVENVWVCLDVQLSAPHQDGTSGGCLDATATGVNQVFQAGNPSNFNAVQTSSGVDFVVFSFEMPSLSSDTQYSVAVHTQVRLVYQNTARRRLSQQGEKNSSSSTGQALGGSEFVHGTTIVSVDETKVLGARAGASPTGDTLPTWGIAFIGVGAALLCGLGVGTVWCWSRSKSKSEEQDALEIVTEDPDDHGQLPDDHEQLNSHVQLAFAHDDSA